MCGARLQRFTDADVIERQRCPQCGWVHYPHTAQSAAGVLLQNRSVLLVQRRHAPFAGSWLFPSGFVGYGEHPQRAVVREVEEETGLIAKVQQLLVMYISEDDTREPQHLAMFFLMTQPLGELRNAAEENFALGWFSLDNLPSIQLANHLAVATLLQDQSLGTDVM